MSDASLTIAGVKYGRWTRFELFRSLESMTPTATFEYSQRDHQRAPIPFEEGLDCEVKIAGQLVFTGFVDEVDVGGDASSNFLRVTVRGKTGDLVDSSAVPRNGSRQWKESTPLQIARDVCAPFDIDPAVENGIDVGTQLQKFSIEEGESCFDLLDRLARARGALLVEDDAGNLVFTKQATGTPDAQIRNPSRYLIGWNRRSSLRDRYSSYVVKAQHAGSDLFSGEQAGQGFFRTLDPNVFRYRPLIIVAEHSKASNLERRALWERNRRAGRGRVLTYRHQGWYYRNGARWRPNILAQVEDTVARVNGTFLVVSVRLTKDENGSTSEVQLMAPEAFDVLKEVPKRW